MENRISLRSKIILAFLSLMVLFSSFHLWIAYTGTNKTVIDTLLAKGERLAVEISKRIDPVLYLQGVDNPQQNDAYWQLCAYLLEIKLATGAMYLDTIVERPDGRWVYIHSGETVEQIWAEPLEEEIDMFPVEEMKKVMAGGIYQTELVDDPDYGLYFATLVPIRDKSGTIIGILELDLAADVVAEVFSNVWSEQLIYSILVDMMMLVLFIGITIWILRFLEAWNKKLGIEVRDRTRQVRLLLDHVGQGFLTIRPDLKVEQEHSAACVHLLGEAPAGLPVIPLIVKEQPEFAEWLPRMFHDLFNATEQHIIDMYIQLMPKEISRNGKTLGLSIEVVRQTDQKPEFVILMINDLTQQRALEDQLKNEEKLMRMIVSVLSRARDYQELVEDYQQFADKEWPALLNSAETDPVADQKAMRIIHTFKGNFAQLNSFLLASHLHELETAVKRGAKESLTAWRDRVSTFEWKSALEEEQRRMFEILPEHNWNTRKDAIPVPRETLMQLRNHINENLPAELAETLVHEVERLYQRSFASLFEPLAEYASQLAVRIEKYIEPVKIQGGEWFADPEPWYEWSKSLVHIVRNQLDHGIEYPDVRIDHGKAYAGNLLIDLKKSDDQVTITFSDDGAGINIIKLRSKLLENGMISADQAEHAADETLYPYLFKDAVSTHEKVTELSGRGVGLAKVLEETEKFGGTVSVFSESGKGTTFIFRIPVLNGRPVQGTTISKTI